MAASSRVPGVIRTARILGIFQTGVMITAIVGLIIDTVAQRRGTGEEARVGDAFMCHSPTLGHVTVPLPARHQTVQTVQGRVLEPSLLMMKSALTPRLR